MAQDYCPICGNPISRGESFHYKPGRRQHRCPPSFTNRHDAALEVERTEGDRRTYGGRLEEGFRMIRGGQP